jgi:hypothetical protein
MSDVSLTITSPAHGSAITAPVALVGSASGNTAGLFFKWFSSLNAAATQTHPEIQKSPPPTDYTPGGLAGTISALGEFGSHALLLTATDQLGVDLASIKAVKRSALTGGAPLPPPPAPRPPNPPPPCVVHQLAGAQFLNPASDGLTLSKANATIDILAPGAWQKEDPPHSNVWIPNTDYQALNGVALALRLVPDGAPAGRASADLPPLVLTTLPVIRQNDKAWLRVAGPLPAALGTGNYRLLLTASAGTGATTLTVSRLVVLAA